MTIKLRTLVKWPAQVLGGDGLLVGKENGIVSIDLALSEFSETPAVGDTAATTVLLITPGATDDDPGVVERISVDNLMSGVSGAPGDAQYIVAASNGGLGAERVATDTTSITWDFGTGGQARAKRAALTGDVTASADSNATTIANDAVTYAKMQDVSATDRLLGRSSSGAGDVEEIACTAAGRALLDDADAAAQIDTLGAAPLAGSKTITGGFAATSIDDGTKSSGTFTPAFTGGNIRRYINGGAHTLSPPTGEGTMIIQVTNNGSAGTITTSGFTMVGGDSLTTTNGHDFMLFISVINGFSTLDIRALQ